MLVLASPFSPYLCAGFSSALSSQSNTGILYSNPLPASLNNSGLNWPGSPTPDRRSPNSFDSPNRAMATLDISSSDILPQPRDFSTGYGHASTFSLQRQAEKQHQYQQSSYGKQQTMRDESFRTAMEPPTSGYPEELSHETSSTSELDFFSSPCRRRPSYPFGSEIAQHYGGGSSSVMDDLFDMP